MKGSPAALDAWKPDQALRRAIPALGLTQMIGWGTTYYLPAVLSPRFQSDLGLDETSIFGAVTVMLITSAFVGIPLGKLIDKHGARRILPVGSILMMIGLLILSQARGAAGYFAAYICMGVAMPMALAAGAHAALAQMAGTGARRAIGLLLLFGGLAATVFWPLTLWLDAALGWRTAVLLYGAIHLLLCAPLHWFLIGERADVSALGEEAAAFLQGTIPPGQRRAAALLMVVCFCCSGFLSWGLDLHLIRILQDGGLSAAAAVGLAAMKGPATLLARFFDVAAAGRISAIGSAIIAAVLTILALMLFLVFGGSFAGAVAFICVFGFGAGLMTVARATLPLTLLGSLGYATTMGRLALPTQLIFAASPMLFGMMIGNWSLSAAFWVAVAAALASLLSLIALSRLPQRG